MSTKRVRSKEKSVRKDERGFTLIELMIVVAVVAVLATIAYPSYQEYVVRSRRVEGQSLLNEVAARQERWRAQNGKYLYEGSAKEIADKLKLPHSDGSERGYYALKIVGDETSYVLTAERAGAQLSDTKCGNFTLDDTGKKGLVANTPGTVDLCWR